MSNAIAFLVGLVCALPPWALALVILFAWLFMAAALVAASVILTGFEHAAREYRNWRSRRAIAQTLGRNQTFFPPESLT